MTHFAPAAGGDGRRRPFPARLLPRAAAVVLAVLTAAVAAPAGAHTSSVGSSPADGATLREAPARVVVTFSEALGAAAGARVELDGRDVAGEPDLAAGDRGRLVIPLAGGGPGAYAVDWEVVAADGHSIAGDLAFTVRGPALAESIAALARSLEGAARAIVAAARA